MEKAGINIIRIFVVGWISIAVACLYLVLNIPWVWADASLSVRIWRSCFVSSSVLLLVGYAAIRIWPSTTLNGADSVPPPSEVKRFPDLLNSPGGSSESKVRPIPTPRTISPIEGLSELGWTVQPSSDEIQFEIANKPLPSGQPSASYFAQLHKPFRLHFQGVKDLKGLHQLAGIAECKKIEINAGEFSDISELEGFSGLNRLGISQTPINGLGTVDISPIATVPRQN